MIKANDRRYSSGRGTRSRAPPRQIRCVFLHSAGDGVTEGNSQKDDVAGLSVRRPPIRHGTSLGTEHGRPYPIQPADKSLINRHLKRSVPCSVQILLSKRRDFGSFGTEAGVPVARSSLLLLTTDIRVFWVFSLSSGRFFAKLGIVFDGSAFMTVGRRCR